MSSDEYAQLLLSKFDDLRADIKDLRAECRDSFRELNVVQDEHSERITAIETRSRIESQPVARRGVNLKKVAVVSGAGGSLMFLPNLIHAAAEFLKALPPGK